MALKLMLRHELSQRQVQRQALGERAGDMPLYSLHRIRTRLIKEPPKMSSEVRHMLTRYLIAENEAFRQETRKKWACLTPFGLTAAITDTKTVITSQLDEALAGAAAYAAAAQCLQRKLHGARDAVIERITQWFVERHDELLYDLDGKIPWPVVQRMRRNLAKWILGETDVFEENTDDMILGVAREAGIETEDAEEAWNKMGGSFRGLRD